jgi:ParB-like chromosome segregation protein Spo0J
MVREVIKVMGKKEIIEVEIEKIKPYEKNNKIHNENEITKIANSIKEFGWTYPILIDENHEILAGHKRLLASKKLGLKKVPVMIKTGLSEVQKKAYRIIDNKSSEESEYNIENLKYEYEKLTELNFNLTDFINDLSYLSYNDDALSFDIDNFLTNDERKEKFIKCPFCNKEFKK